VRSAQVLAVRALLVGALLASAGCFRPGNLSGRFSCGNNGACPDGLLCNSSNICVSSIGGASGTGGKVGTGGVGGKDAGPPDVSPDRPCIGAIASCQPSDAGMCDPVCNIGCGECYQKCSVNGNGALTCNAPMGPNSPGLVSGLCDPTVVGPAQTDDCQAGQVCVKENLCGYRCYQFCRASSDCTNGASCSLDAGGGYSLCDVPPITCNPAYGVAGGATSQCPGATANSLFGCYLSATSTATLCDCQNTNGGGVAGSRCSHSRDCYPGLVCYDPTSSNPKTCRRVCRLPGDGGVDLTQPGEGGCASGVQACTPIAFPDGTTNPTFGFCND
jgi:hypothetical protein